MSKKSQMPPPPGESVVDLDGSSELDVAAEELPVAPPKPVARKKLKVVANRHGYIFSERKVPGDEFEVHEHELGSWMDCMDPVEQKKHVARVSAKKKAVNARAVKDHERELEADE